MNELFTFGHSDHEQEHFLALLRPLGIAVVADVRSSPYSSRFPQFNREGLQANLRRVGVQYVFLGNELGARRSEPECYVNGQAIYERIAETPSFKHAFIAWFREQLKCASRCFVQKVIDCHRAILVCRYLKAAVPSISHIRGDGCWKHQQLEGRLLQQFELAETRISSATRPKCSTPHTSQSQSASPTKRRPSCNREPASSSEHDSVVHDWLHQEIGREFFTKLKEAGVRRLVDIRLNNKSQLAGFTKQEDLAYFLQEIGVIETCTTRSRADTRHSGRLQKEESRLANLRNGIPQAYRRPARREHRAEGTA